MLKCLISKIPGRYLDDFYQEQLKLTKNRVKLLCFLTVGVYFALSLFDLGLGKNAHFFIDMTGGLFLVLAGMLTVFLGDRSKSLRTTKSTAFLFVSILVAILVRLGIVYYETSVLSSVSYVFAMLIVVMTVPWTPAEILPLGAIYVTGFLVENFYVSHMAQTRLSPDFISGMLFIMTSIILCVILRRKEVERDVDNFILLKAVEEKNVQMKKDLELATRVHKTIIPEGIDTDTVAIRVTYLPAYYVGGDYACYAFLPHDRVTFIISDVTGHGVPAALLVNRMHSEFENLAKEGKEPGELMKDLNVFIKEDFEGSGMYLTAFCGQLDLRKMELLYSSYAHPSQYLYGAKTGQLISMPSLAGMLGMDLDQEECYQKNLPVEQGDRIFLYTDGVTETFNSSREEYGNSRLERFIETNHLLTIEQLDKKLISELNGFKSGPFRDDICMLDIEIRAHSSFLARHWHGQEPVK
jgi:serine phosphatase RsbU (regulator of sigma subunit)